MKEKPCPHRQSVYVLLSKNYVHKKLFLNLTAKFFLNPNGQKYFEFKVQ